MRVGSHAFDNTDHVYSDAYSGSRYDPGRLPLDDNYIGFRQVLWLATDRAYKTAEEAIARKRSSLKNVSQPEQLPDFSKAAPRALHSAHSAQTVCAASLEEAAVREAFRSLLQAIRESFAPAWRCIFRSPLITW